MSKLAELFVILILFLLGDLLNLFKGLAVNDWLMGITDNNPVGFVHIGLSFSFVEGLLFSPLNHVTYVNGMCQHIFDYLRMPQHTLVLFRLDFARLIEIGRRRKNTGIVEPAPDLHNTNTLGTPLEYLSNRRSCFFVDNSHRGLWDTHRVPKLR